MCEGNEIGVEIGDDVGVEFGEVSEEVGGKFGMLVYELEEVVEVVEDEVGINLEVEGVELGV